MGSIAGVCQRSSAAIHQSRVAEPSAGTTAPHGVTRPRHEPPSTPTVTPAGVRARARPTGRRGRGGARRGSLRVGARGLPLLTRTLARVRAAVLVPVKGFGAAKRRLAGVLGPTERAELARRMAERVVAAAAPLPVHVVCDDDEVADWAERAGTQVLWRPGHGLNGAIADGLASLAKLGVDPRRHRPRRPAAGPRPGLADRARRDHPRARPPRRRHQRRRPPGGARRFRFAYGPGSFRHHRTEAARHGLGVRVRRDPRLGLDVDLPDDLARPGVKEVLGWPPTSPANPR